MREFPPCLTGGRGHDEVCLLGLLERRQQRVTRRLPERLQQRQAKAATEDGAEREHPPSALTDPLQPTADDQANPLWHVELFQDQASAPVSVRVEERPFFREVLEHLFHEEGVALGLAIHPRHQRRGWRRSPKCRQTCR